MKIFAGWQSFFEHFQAIRVEFFEILAARAQIGAI
jgi:hypothetical protein